MGIEKFKLFVDEYQKKADYKAPLGFGIARVEIGKKSKAVLCATYPTLNWQGENLGTYAVLCESAQEAELIAQSENEAVYGITNAFVAKALELYAPFLSEALGDSQTHKNIQVILELKKQMEKGKLKTKGGRSRYRFCILYKDTKCESVESAYLKLLA
ncbi:tetrahydrodipicolinate N-succinyltransferase N-terminal domain-containing protein, partial [uncultured Helicobacter sp.]